MGWGCGFERRCWLGCFDRTGGRRSRGGVLLNDRLNLPMWTMDNGMNSRVNVILDKERSLAVCTF